MIRFPRCPISFVNKRKCIAMGILGFVSVGSSALANPSSSETFSVRVAGIEDENGAKLPVTNLQVAKAIAVTQKRLEAMGFTNPEITKKGTDGFLIRLEGFKPDSSPDIPTALSTPGKLELREVNPRSEETGSNDRTLAQRVQDGDEVVPGYRAYTHKGKDADGKDFKRPILLNRRTALGNPDIANAIPSPLQADAVAVTLNRAGEDKMIALTRNMQPMMDRIAIVLDGEVISAPILIDVPLGKHFMIDGLRDPGEAQSLANAFLNPLESPLIIEKERQAPANKDAK